MVFRSDVLGALNESYRNVAAHFADVRSFYEVVDARLASGEYGVSLRSVSGRRLFSSTDAYWLPGDDLDAEARPEPGACPHYIWLPTWLGRFYVRVPLADREQTPRDLRVGQLGFVWIWCGFNDAFVADTNVPECWFGTVTMKEQPVGSLPSVAKKIWHFFRFEWTHEGDSDGWMTGRFGSNPNVADLSASWALRRASLDELVSYYQIEDVLIQPLVKRHGIGDGDASAPRLPNGSPQSANNAVETRRR